MRKVFSILFLLLAYDFLWIGGASAWLLSKEGDQAFIAIGAACVLGTGATYAARVGLEDGRWERLYMPLLPALLAAIFAVYGIANAGGITVGEVSLGFVWTLVVGALLALPPTVVHLCIRRQWNQKSSSANPSAGP